MKMRDMVGMALAVMLVMSTIGCTRVGPGYAGIKVNMAGSERGVEDFPATTGWVFYNPLSSTVFEYPTFVQNATWQLGPINGGEDAQPDESITFTTKDKMQVSVDVGASYQLDFAKVPHFYVKFRTDDLNTWTHTYFRALARDKFNLVGGKYNIDQIMGGHAEFLAEVKQALQADLTPYGVVMGEQFGIIGAPRPPATVIASINASVQATQFAVQKQNELVQVQADAAKQVAQAEGEAKSVLVRAEAEATANRQVAQSLTPELIRWRTNSKWDGRLPQFTGNGAIPMIQLGDR